MRVRRWKHPLLLLLFFFLNKQDEGPTSVTVGRLTVHLPYLRTKVTALAGLVLNSIKNIHRTLLADQSIVCKLLTVGWYVNSL